MSQRLSYLVAGFSAVAAVAIAILFILSFAQKEVSVLEENAGSKPRIEVLGPNVDTIPLNYGDSMKFSQISFDDLTPQDELKYYWRVDKKTLGRLEEFTFIASSDLEAGPHIVELAVVDADGNEAIKQWVVELGETEQFSPPAMLWWVLGIVAISAAIVPLIVKVSKRRRTLPMKKNDKLRNAVIWYKKKGLKPAQIQPMLKRMDFDEHEIHDSIHNAFYHEDPKD